jgi:uncharacterized membrane protein YqjE
MISWARMFLLPHEWNFKTYDMNSMSLLFIGLMLVPYTAFIVWLLKQDKRKNTLGIIVLMTAILATLLVAIYIDSKYM